MAAPTTRVIIGGNEADAWTLSDLPGSIRGELVSIAHRRGYRDELHLLSAPDEPWQPAFPLSKARQDFVDKAVKLRGALEWPVAHKDDASISPGDFERAGVAAYQKEFGYSITARHWRRLFRRTVDRDRGQGNWSRLEVYMDDNSCQASESPTPEDRALIALHQDALGDALKMLESKTAPTADDRKFLFSAAFRHHETLNADKTAKPRKLRRSLIAFLWDAVKGLAKNKASFERVFYMKLAAWTEAGGALESLQDRRRQARGVRPRPEFAPDLKKIRDSAIRHDGNISLAYRKARQCGDLSDDFVNHYHFDERQNKSYVPRPVREAITPEVEMCGPIHRGPHEAKMRGPYIPRDWSDVSPGDWFSGDDVTWNNYFYFYDAGGVLQIHRGECLLIHDLRTGYLLDYVLIAGKYNSRHIRSLILAVHDSHGLPHTGYYFERGVWKAGIIEDLAAKEASHNHWRETESGLANYNLQVRHATTPRAKTIEGLIRILQERQRSEPGYVSGNERLHEMERMQDFIARARSGKVHPGEKLLEMSQWTKRLDEIFAEFNADPQNGKMLRGQSPSEAWQAGLDSKPLRKLPDDARYLLATHCKRVKVHQHGIVLTIGKDKVVFCNDQTGPLIGREVLAFYNLECPDLLIVSDLNRQNYFTLKAVCLPAMRATKEQFAAVNAQIKGHQSAARAIYGAIEHPKIATITRDAAVTENASELGQFHNAETERFQQEKTATNRTLGKIQRRAATGGMAIRGNIRNPDRVLQGIEMEDAWREEQSDAQLETAEIPAPVSYAKKTYTLHTSQAPVGVGVYWSLWAQVEKISPGLSRHAITQKAIGCHPMPTGMTPEQLAKMISVFSAMLREATKTSA
jgi:hypothetical protein